MSRKIESRLGDLLAAPTRRRERRGERRAATRAIARVASPLPSPSRAIPNMTPRCRCPRPRCAPLLQVPCRAVPCRVVSCRGAACPSTPSVSLPVSLSSCFSPVLSQSAFSPFLACPASLALTQARGNTLPIFSTGLPPRPSPPILLSSPLPLGLPPAGGTDGRTDGVPPSMSRSLIKRQTASLLALAPCTVLSYTY